MRIGIIFVGTSARAVGAGSASRLDTVSGRTDPAVTLTDPLLPIPVIPEEC